MIDGPATEEEEEATNGANGPKSRNCYVTDTAYLPLVSGFPILFYAFFLPRKNEMVLEVGLSNKGFAMPFSFLTGNLRLLRSFSRMKCSSRILQMGMHKEQRKLW